MPFVTNSDKIAFLQSVFGSVEIHRDHVNVSVRCPNTACPSNPIGLQKRKLAIRIDDDRAHCWVCGIKGRLAKILRQYVGREALIRYVGSFEADKLRNFDSHESNPIVFPPKFQLLGSYIGKRAPHLNAHFRYLYGRGLTEKDIWYYKLGFSPGGEWDNRIIMPSFDGDGHLNWLTGRAIFDYVKPKYIVPDGDKDIVFNEINIDWTRELTLVEGPFDLTKCDENATCIQGSELNPNSYLFKMIVMHNTPVILALDSDAKKKAAKIAASLQEFDVDIKMLELNGFKDVGEMTKQDFLNAKREALPWTWDRHMLQKISTIK